MKLLSRFVICRYSFEQGSTFATRLKQLELFFLYKNASRTCHLEMKHQEMENRSSDFILNVC